MKPVLLVENQTVGLWWDAIDRVQWPTDPEEIEFVKRIGMNRMAIDVKKSF